MKNYDALLRAFNGSIWAIIPEKMDAIIGLLHARASGILMDAATVEKVAAANKSGSEPTVRRSVAVLPIYGTIAQRVGLLESASGGVSTERIGRQFDALVADDNVGAIVLDVDSPGGNYAGTPELAAKIMAARGSKPIVAVANSMAASAAYWIASAADEIVVTPSGEVGSIGVLSVHYDGSEANAKEGIKPTYVTYGKYKAEANPDGPLSDDARDYLQSRVDEVGREFEGTVAKHRGVGVGVVRETFGQGRMFAANEAVKRGMADRTATLESTIDRLAKAKRVSTGRRAVAEREKLALEKYRS
jgi:signal peptide peptidase SppA